MSAVVSPASRRSWIWWIAMATVVAAAFAFAGRATPTGGTSDDRLFALAGQLKCLQCVGESVAGSQAPLAEQFREEIRAQMEAGATDDEILGFFVDRYGEQVLLTPPSSGLGSLVWIIPVGVVGAATVAVVLSLSRRRLPADESAPAADTEPTDAGPPDTVLADTVLADTVLADTVLADTVLADTVHTVAEARGSGDGGIEHGAVVDASQELTGGDSEGGATGGVTRGRGWRRPVAVGGVVVFFVLLGWALLHGTAERRGTGGGGGAAASTEDQLAACRSLAMRAPQDADACYGEVLDDDPESVEALAYRGWARVRAGETAAGSDDLDRAVQLDPEYPDARVFTAIVATDQGDFEAAAEEIAVFYSLEPSGFAASIVASEGLERKIFFGLMDETTSQCWQQAAVAGGDSGEIDQAFLDSLGACLDLVLAADPANRDARFSRALAHLGPDGSAAAATPIVDGLLAEDPKDADALGIAATIALSEGDLDAAQTAIDRLAELPRAPSAFLIGDVATLQAALDAAREAKVPNPDGG